jgi:hypothetical protein
MATREERSNRQAAWIIRIAAAVFLAFSLWLYGDYQRYSAIQGSMYTGRIVSKGYQAGSLAPRLELEVENASRDMVYAILAVNGHKRLSINEKVRFRYGGSPGSEVQLESEGSSFTLAAVLSMASVFMFVLSFFLGPNESKAQRRKARKAKKSKPLWEL